MHVSRLLILGLVAGLAACSGDKTLRTMPNNSDGPDEFRIIPGKELTQPKDYNALPLPAPGGVNRTDLDPVGDAMVALGGRAPSRENTNQIASADAALVTYASRNGRTADIRQTTRLEDEEFRKKRGRFTQIRLKKTNIYEKVYAPQDLEEVDEWWRWRRAGAKTPAAPATE
ncbi:beta-barrel assembly complex subunit BamF [Shimia isoporae]|uniref:Beta-barrel assembly complex subunit BamF n=1 Tax=Shimia isoporae TaxID=647720 RepID=A0A4R1N5F5_9RHOB|nr:DUF3035 domain-containing protein [Shimia isoporae]TCL01282.1 beta-barrel assembly complex subunit BamF [Shimia isoporae]